MKIVNDYIAEYFFDDLLSKLLVNELSLLLLNKEDW